MSHKVTNVQLKKQENLIFCNFLLFENKFYFKTMLSSFIYQIMNYDIIKRNINVSLIVFAETIVSSNNNNN